MRKDNLLEDLLLREDNRGENCKVCVALSKLYSADRPISARAYAMKAKRLGAEDLPIPSKSRDEIPESDSAGSYLLGKELCEMEQYEEALPYLEAAGHSKDHTVAAMASLYLADLLSYHSTADPKVISSWYRRAAKLGNPDLLEG